MIGCEGGGGEGRGARQAPIHAPRAAPCRLLHRAWGRGATARRPTAQQPPRCRCWGWVCRWGYIWRGRRLRNSHQSPVPATTAALVFDPSTPFRLPVAHSDFTTQLINGQQQYRVCVHMCRGPGCMRGGGYAAGGQDGAGGDHAWEGAGAWLDMLCEMLCVAIYQLRLAHQSTAGINTRRAAAASSHHTLAGRCVSRRTQPCVILGAAPWPSAAISFTLMRLASALGGGDT